MDADSILDQGFDQNGLNVNSRANAYLLEISKWTKFLSIVSFVIFGLIIVGAIYVLSFNLRGMIGLAPLSSFISLAILLVICLYPTFKLFNFSKNIKIALEMNSDAQLSIAFGELKSMFKFLGIFTLIFVILYVSIFLFGGAAALMSF